MKKIFKIAFITLAVVFAPRFAISQEEKPIDIEESAEVFLEDYTDEFQENFFEALKQKGIENYDKAINLLLKCKQLDVNKKVVDYELAKAYLLNKQYSLAREYALYALESEPENIWYSYSLVEVLVAMGTSAKEIVATVPNSNSQLMENLALIFFKRKQYKHALVVLDESIKSDFTKELTAKINDSLNKKNKLKTPKQNNNPPASKVEPSNELEEYKQRIDKLINSGSATDLLKASEVALENYPSQPYFYFANGYALNKSANYKGAIEVLETALDYLINDVDLANKIYKELSEANTGIGDLEKAKKYLSKIKNP